MPGRAASRCAVDPVNGDPVNGDPVDGDPVDGPRDNGAVRAGLCLPRLRRRANIGPTAGATGTSMIISCPECGGKFRIDSSALGAGGRTVRCGKCAHTWLQAPPDSDAGPVSAADAGSRGDAEYAVAGDTDADDADTWELTEDGD